MKTGPTDHAFERGKADAQSGKSPSDNPYSPDSWTHNRWARGYDAARFTVTSDDSEPTVREG